MKKVLTLFVFAALFSANAFATYVVVMKDGTRYNAKAKWTVVKGKAIIVLENGQSLQLDPALIDEARSEQATKRGLVNANVIDLNANLPPAHLLTASDIGRVLDMRSADVAVVLGTLRKLSLVDRTLGADDGEDGYRLTKAGEVFLAACSRTAPAKVAASSLRTARPKRIEPTLGST